MRGRRRSRVVLLLRKVLEQLSFLVLIIDIDDGRYGCGTTTHIDGLGMESYPMLLILDRSLALVPGPVDLHARDATAPPHRCPFPAGLITWEGSMAVGLYSTFSKMVIGTHRSHLTEMKR